VRVCVIQSSYIPWRGYFDLIASSDAFVFHDDIQYTKGDWRNRNRLKTMKGTEWITVPVSYKNVAQLICETPIDFSTPWQRTHLRVFGSCYRQASYFDVASKLLGGIEEVEYSTISQLNVYLIKRICEYLNISTPMTLSNDLNLEGKKTERLIDLLKKLNATTYLSGPSADAYLDKEQFRRNNICLEYKSYDYEPYPQLWGKFIGEVTVLDLIANCGPKAGKYLRSRSPDFVVA
jgi:hypothetical protein